MKIKNIRQYRSFYKTTRLVSKELEERGVDEIDYNYYLLVVNNGGMFDLNSISSILNV